MPRLELLFGPKRFGEIVNSRERRCAAVAPVRFGVDRPETSRLIARLGVLARDVRMDEIGDLEPCSGGVVTQRDLLLRLSVHADNGAKLVLLRGERCTWLRELETPPSWKSGESLS